jgi:wobble nucleotide-excising tRNase
MTVTRVSHLRDCGVFRDFAWPNDLHDFGRFNLIYGWNGSGKTTLSRLFRDLEARRSPAAGQATFSINGHDVRGEDFAQVMLPIRVFNRDFLMDSVFPVGGGDVPPIFVVGKESVEKQKEAERLKASRAEAQAELESARSTKQGAERAFDRFCIDRARVIKDTLRSSGSNLYNNYDKSNFQVSAQKMTADGDAATHRLTEAGREKLLAQHRATPKPKVQSLTYQQPALKSLADAVSDLLSTTVVSAAIQSLKDDPALSAWARQGLVLHQERHAVKCLFCEQTMPKDRLAALEAHFNAAYEQFMEELDDKITEIRSASNAASELALPNRAQLYDDLAAEYEPAEAALQEDLNATKRSLDFFVQVLMEKRGRAFEPVAVNVAVPEVDSGVVDRLNEVVRKHNQACDDFQSRISTARERMEADFVAGDLEEFVRLRDAVRRSEVGVKDAVAKVERLTGEILRLEREIVEHRQPAEELNEDLRKYLGHDELRLEIKDSGYTITRYGVPAETLSEGEVTALALLYFLKSLRDRRFDLAKGLVVLDDPVSSLDANALYLAFGFIRERTKDAAQLFIFTHNFTFFRQVRNWFHHLPGQKRTDVNQRPARFYMVDCAREGDQRCANIRPLDPLLEEYESEYHYLFARIHRAASSASAAGLEKNYVLPNMARRLMEAFLAFRQPDVSGELWQKVKDVNFDEAKKVRILRFLHTHSHGDAVGEPEHDPSLLGEADSVLKDLLDFIKGQDPKHFGAMVKLVNPPAAEKGDG